MLTMILNQYVSREKEDTLYLLESDNAKMDNAIQYLEEMALAIQHNVGIKSFLTAEHFSKENAAQQLKIVANLFSERNRTVSQEPFVEMVYLFRFSGESIYNLYYPTLVTEIRNSNELYREMNERFREQKKAFYYEVWEDEVNLCLNLYDEGMEPMGTCIFVLNRAGIEEIYANVEKMEDYGWSISQGEEHILGSGNPRILKSSTMQHTLSTGFGLTLKAAVSHWQIYRSLGTTMAIMLIISGGIILLSALIGYTVARIFVRPLETVAEKIKLVGKGDFDTKLGEYQAEELEIVKFYLSLQNSRFGDKITYSITYAGGRECYEHFLVPRLSIEPSVENAVCHGLEPKGENGHISVRIFLEKEDRMCILIQDNGVGFDLRLLDSPGQDRRHNHVGINNTDRMIKNLCGEEYGLHIESKPGEGTRVIISLPVKRAE